MLDSVGLTALEVGHGGGNGLGLERVGRRNNRDHGRDVVACAKVRGKGVEVGDDGRHVGGTDKVRRSKDVAVKVELERCRTLEEERDVLQRQERRHRVGVDGRGIDGLWSNLA